MLRPLHALALMVLAYASGCEGGDGALAAQLRACNLLSEGALGPYTLQRFYAPSACYEHCLGSASCEELAGYLCGTSIAAPLRCDQRCAFRCGDGSLIAVEAACDGFAQCADGSDEVGCAVFPCGDGMELPARARCDGWSQCSDGSDEAGCGAPITCDGGRLREWTRCDGVADCRDGNDERDCPVHTCTNGEILRGRSDPRCNGWAECRDGSDELHCASLTPMCS